MTGDTAGDRTGEGNRNRYFEPGILSEGRDALCAALPQSKDLLFPMLALFALLALRLRED